MRYVEVLTVPQIRKALRDRKLAVVAERTGLHYNTLRSIRDGLSWDIKFSTVETLTKYFEGQA